MMVLRRTAVTVMLLWLVSVLVFAATLLLPGDAARAILGHNATPEGLAALRTQLHLDDPPADQYVRWLHGLVTGDWGRSLVSNQSVVSIVENRAQDTAVLALLATLVTTPLALALGTISAIRSNGWLDHVLSAVTLSLAALPPFVIGIGLIYLLASGVFHLLQPVAIVDPSTSIWHQMPVVTLPTITLILAVIPYPIRMVRGSMVEALQSDYVMLARLRGLPEWRVIVRHALRNSLGPTIQATALNLLYLAGGVVVVESVFNYPGIGNSLVDAVNERDIPVIQTITILLAALYLTINLVADILVVLVTPKLRTRG